MQVVCGQVEQLETDREGPEAAAGGVEGLRAAARHPGAFAASQARSLPRLRGTEAARAFWIAVAVIAAVDVLHVLNAAVVDGSLFNLSAGWNVPTVVSSLLFVAAAVAALKPATSAALAGDSRTLWFGVSVVSGLLAIEALVNVHALVEEALDEDLVIVLTVPLLVVLALVALPPLLRLRAPAPLLLLAAAALLVLAQVASVFDNVLDVEGVAEPLGILFEENAEMLAPALIIAAALDAARPIVAGRDPVYGRPAPSR